MYIWNFIFISIDSFLFFPRGYRLIFIASLVVHPDRHWGSRIQDVGLKNQEQGFFIIMTNLLLDYNACLPSIQYIDELWGEVRDKLKRAKL